MKTTPDEKTEYRMRFNVSTPEATAGMAFAKEKYGIQILPVIVQMAVESFFDPAMANAFRISMGIPFLDGSIPTAKITVAEAPALPGTGIEAKPEPDFVVELAPTTDPIPAVQPAEEPRKIGATLNVDEMMGM